MNTIEISNYKLYDIDIYINGHWSILFLSSNTKTQVKKLCDQFEKYIFELKEYPDNIKELFFKYMKYNNINFIDIKKEHITIE